MDVQVRQAGRLGYLADQMPHRDAGERLAAFADKERVDARRRIHLRSLNQPRLHRLALAVVEIVRTAIRVFEAGNVKRLMRDVDIRERQKVGGRGIRVVWKRATEMVPISKDAMEGSGLVENLALVYAWADEPNLAFEQLSILIKGPNIFGVPYGVLKVDPNWDPLRKDPRFGKFLAELAPREQQVID